MPTGNTNRPYRSLALWLLASCLVCVASVAAGQRPSPPAPPGAQKEQPKQFALATGPWKGDFDEMVKRRRIRILTPYNKTHYFVDKGVQRGVVYDAGVVLEDAINKNLKTTPATRVNVLFIPTSRDDLYQALIDGRGDIVAANVTVTPERARLVDFTVPDKTDVKEIVVTGPGAAALTTIDDLAGKLVHVRDKSLQFEDLTALNAALKKRGKGAVTIRTVPEALEDEDILEMVNAGLVKATVVDDFMGEFWQQILPNLTLHPTLAVREGGSIAWAVRKDSPQLVAALNPVIEANKAGTVFGNVLLQKYLKSAKFVKSATSGSEFIKYQALMEIFKKFSAQYGLDYVLMMAQGYQESGLDQAMKSRVGAIGVMQLMPATGQAMKVGDIHDMEANVHAGVKYIRFMIDQYYANEPMNDLNKTLFAFAAYNCGAGRVRQLRQEASSRGLNPNVWFNNVERIAGERIGRETVQYVSNIYKYYVAYSLAQQELLEKTGARQGITVR